MQNNKLNQNQRNQQLKRFHPRKIVLDKNGKISLSKSTRVSSQLSAKNQQINLLKCEVLQLKVKLQKQKAQSRKISILSDEIKRVKEKLIEKINEKNAQQVPKLSQQFLENVESQYFGSSLQEQLKSDEIRFIPQKEHIKNEKMKQSTLNIFRNFSLFNSDSIKSQTEKINDPEMRFIEKRKAPQSDRKNIDHKFREEPTENTKDKKEALNRLKFKKNLGSFFENKTVKNDHHQERHSKPFFYNKFQQEEWNEEGKRLEQTKKLSIVDFKRKMKK